MRGRLARAQRFLRHRRPRAPTGRAPAAGRPQPTAVPTDAVSMVFVARTRRPLAAERVAVPQVNAQQTVIAVPMDRSHAVRSVATQAAARVAVTPTIVARPTRPPVGSTVVIPPFSAATENVAPSARSASFDTSARKARSSRKKSVAQSNGLVTIDAACRPSSA
jgi:hypothetical protein